MSETSKCEISLFFIRRTTDSQVDIGDPSLGSKVQNHTKLLLLEHAKEIEGELVRGGLHGWPILDEHSSDEPVVVKHDCEKKNNIILFHFPKV